MSDEESRKPPCRLQPVSLEDPCRNVIMPITVALDSIDVLVEVMFINLFELLLHAQPPTSQSHTLAQDIKTTLCASLPSQPSFEPFILSPIQHPALYLHHKEL